MATRKKLRRYDRMAVLDFIDRYQHNTRRSPSQRRICQALEMSAPSVAHNAVHALVRKGLLEMSVVERGVSADLTITRRGRDQLKRWRREQQATTAQQIRGTT